MQLRRSFIEQSGDRFGCSEALALRSAFCKLLFGMSAGIALQVSKSLFNCLDLLIGWEFCCLAQKEPKHIAIDAWVSVRDNFWKRSAHSDGSHCQIRIAIALRFLFISGQRANQSRDLKDIAEPSHLL